MNIIELTYLPKNYKAVPFTHHERITGGRITNIDKFYACCSEKNRTDAEWIITKSIQPLDETSYGFAIVGLSELLKRPVIVKIMLNDEQGIREATVQRFFKKHPHRNIVQGICEFTCRDSPVRWKVHLREPKKLCRPRKHNEIKDFIIIVQEFIERGDIDNNIKDLNYEQWKSLFLQTLFATMELFEKHGFTYGDWKLRNILLDETIDSKIIYTTFGRKWLVKNTYGLTPVFTDFSLCEFEKEKEPRLLAYQISYCVDMYGTHCKKTDVKDYCIDFSMKIEEATKLDTIIQMIELFIENLESNDKASSS
jgi:serine/threonine protein kinase